MYVQASSCRLVLIVLFLCSVFIMSQAAATTAITTTLPVTVVYSGTSSFLMIATMTPTLIGLLATLGQHDVVLPQPLIPWDTRGVVGPTTVPQQQSQFQMPFQVYANYAMGPLQVSFPTRVESPCNFLICIVVYSGVCFLLSGTMLDALVTNEAQPLGFAPLQSFGAYTWPGNGHGPSPGMHCMTALSTTLSGEASTQSAVLKSFQLYGGAYNFGGLAESHIIPLPSLQGGEASSFPGLVSSNDTVNSESVMGIKPGDSSVIIMYQVDEYTHTWCAEQFFAHSRIYLGFTGKVSSLTYFPLEPECKDYSFPDQAVADFEQGLDSILTDSIETPELDTFFDEPDVINSSVSFGFLHLVSTVSDTSKPQLASNIRFHKLWCQGRALLSPVSLATKMSASKLIHYFSNYPAAFRFWSSTPPDNITLTSANRMVNQRLLEFLTGIGAAPHDTVNAELFISHITVALVDTICILPHSEGGGISVSKVCELPIRIHDILDNTMSKQVGNSAHILANIFNFAPRQHCEVWASQFPFLHSLKDIVPPSEVCLYHHINWSLAQYQQQSFMGLFKSFPHMRAGKARPRTWFYFNVQ